MKCHYAQQLLMRLKVENIQKKAQNKLGFFEGMVNQLSAEQEVATC
jgi:hypothetical protein